MKYIIDHCKQDIKTLREGYNKLKKWTKQDFNIDIDSVLTISSLMDKYVRTQGAFEDVYELTGVTRAFIQQSVVGGRTTISLHDKKYFGSKILNYTGIEPDFNVEYNTDEVEQTEFVNEFIINPKNRFYTLSLLSKTEIKAKQLEQSKTKKKKKK